MADDEQLPPGAARAWRAYRDMADAKSAHLALLTAIEERRQEGTAPTIAEGLKLEALLAQHDAAVAEFSRQVAALRQDAPHEFARLMHRLQEADEH